MFLFLYALIFLSCEKKIDIKTNDGFEKLVVEGHIEAGLPPYVVLTKSQPYFSNFNVQELSNLFVHNAFVTVSNSSDTVVLNEISSDTIPPLLLKIISGQLGINLASKNDPQGIKVSIYTTLDSKMFGQIGETYNVKIITNNQELSATTSIPKAAKIDSLWTVPHPSNDTLSTVFIRYSDPGDESNFIRYFTSTNGQPFFPPYFQSVLDDKSIFDVNGKTFDFPIEKGQYRNKKIDFDTFTYFTKGDSIVVRWCAVDQAHFDFWNTAEFDRGSMGNPFTSPVTIKSNIKGGLGIWGGYSPSYYVLKIE